MRVCSRCLGVLKKQGKIQFPYRPLGGVTKSSKEKQAEVEAAKQALKPSPPKSAMPSAKENITVASAKQDKVS
jgi:cobyrinic acid a,c-diamide synthase